MGGDASAATSSTNLLSQDDLDYLTAAADKIGAMSQGPNTETKDALRKELMQDARLMTIVGLAN